MYTVYYNIDIYIYLRWGTRNPQTRNGMRVEGSTRKPATCCGLKFNQKRCLGLNLGTNEYFKKTRKTRNGTRVAGSTRKPAKLSCGFPNAGACKQVRIRISYKMIFV